MKKIVYIVFSLCSIGFTGSILAAEHINLLIGIIGFGLTYVLGAVTLEALDIELKDTNETVENTFVEKV